MQGITVDECIEEGIQPLNCIGCTFECDVCPNEGCYNEVDAFMEIWNSTIKKADLNRYGWEANPWVWVIEFERCKEPKGSDGITFIVERNSKEFVVVKNRRYEN